MFFITKYFISLIFFFTFYIILLSFFGIIYNYKNLIFVLIFAETALAGIFLYSCFIYIITGYIPNLIFSLIILNIAACETGIGLSLIISYYRLTNKLEITSNNE